MDTIEGGGNEPVRVSPAPLAEIEAGTVQFLAAPPNAEFVSFSTSRARGPIKLLNSAPVLITNVCSANSSDMWSSRLAAAR